MSYEDPPPIIATSPDEDREVVFDPAWLRRFSVRARVVSIAVLSVVVVVLVAGVAVGALVFTSKETDRADRLADAARLNIEADVAGRAVHELATAATIPSGSALDAAERQAARASARVGDALADDPIAEERVAAAAHAQAVQAARALAAMRSGGEEDAVLEKVRDDELDAFEGAVAARGRLDSEIDNRRRESVGGVRDLRTRWLIATVVIVVAGAVLLVIVGLFVGRSVIVPVRDLGRAIRRFGDGDLRSRGVDAPDEVGTLARSFNSTAVVVASRVRTLRDDAERGTRLRIIAEALDLAHDESDVHRIVEHAMGIVAAGRPAELLINSAESTALHQAAVNPNGGAPNCPVDETMACVAIRRARTITWEGPDQINACPMLRDRPGGPCSAVCVPINAGGSLVGVLHATGAVGDPPPSAVAEQLVVLGGQAGTRIGSMRTLEISRVEAATDGLTGVANRRMLSATLADLLRTSTPFVLVVADLDHFKQLNDRYGHEVGDRALQLFAEVLQNNVRGRDLVARYGGEEFVLVYPEMNVKLSMEVLERVRAALAAAVRSANLPAFTASFGVTHSSVAPDVDSIIRTADAGLLMAKDLGRDRVVYADADLAAEVFRGRNASHP